MADRKNFPGNFPRGNQDNKPGDTKKPKFNSYWIIGIILLVMIGIQLLSSSGGLQEIDSNRFFQVLQNGDIEKIVIVNKEKVEIYIKPERLTDPAYDDIKSQKSNTVFGQSLPQYFFTIISQDVFVGELNKVMNGLPEENRPTYTTLTRRNYFGEIMLWVLPFLLILGIIIWRNLPQAALWLVGVLVGIKLIFAGAAMTAIGMTGRRAMKKVQKAVTA